MYIRQLLIIKMRATLLTPDEIESMQMDEELFRVSTKESLVQKKRRSLALKRVHAYQSVLCFLTTREGRKYDRKKKCQ